MILGEKLRSAGSIGSKIIGTGLTLGNKLNYGLHGINAGINTIKKLKNIYSNLEKINSRKKKITINYFKNYLKNIFLN